MLLPTSLRHRSVVPVSVPQTKGMLISAVHMGTETEGLNSQFHLRRPARKVGICALAMMALAACQNNDVESVNSVVQGFGEQPVKSEGK